MPVEGNQTGLESSALNCLNCPHTGLTQLVLLPFYRTLETLRPAQQQTTFALLQFFFWLLLVG